MAAAAPSSTPWLQSRLAPKTSGDLRVSVRYRSGQVSTFQVSSTTTVRAFKELVQKGAIVEALAETPVASLALLYLGKPLDDDAATLEACHITDLACLVEAAPSRELAANDAFRAANIADIKAAKSERHPTHTALLYERIKHNLARGMDLDLDLVSWHIDYEPYAQYVPPKAGKPQIQAPAYEADGDQAFRRDYYVSGPGNQSEINKEHALFA